MIYKIVSFILMFCLIGCNSTLERQSFIVEQTSEVATITTLDSMDASIQEANNIRNIAIQVDLHLDEGELDNQKIKQFVLESIDKNFDGSDKIYLLTLTNEITNAVLLSVDVAEVKNQEEVLVLVESAAQGVSSGANIYILANSDES